MSGSREWGVCVGDVVVRVCGWCVGVGVVGVVARSGVPMPCLVMYCVHAFVRLEESQWRRARVLALKSQN